MITSPTTEYFNHESNQFVPIFKYLSKPVSKKDLKATIQDEIRELETGKAQE